MSLAEATADYIRDSLPLQLFNAVPEHFDAAYHEAARRAAERGRYDHSVRRHVLGHERHWNLDRALVAAARAAGLDAEIASTIPRGGLFSVIKTDDWIIGRASAPYSGARLRPARYRSMLAELNRFASDCGDLLSGPTRVAPPRYGLFLSSGNRHAPEEMARLWFGVPRPGLQSWMLFMPLEELVAGYAAPETVREVEPETVEDRAVPKLKG